MKKYRYKQHLKFGIFLFGISVCMYSCQKDDNTNGPQEKSRRKAPKSLKSRFISIDSLFNENKAIKWQLSKIGMNLND
ncbi:MAG: hypothetical protein ACJARX_001731 [Psychroserpens sp.]|jgi:hypothetical protein|uniref:hypothetical protein n=1 Tax=Psychroserpens sp. TaxID=2020870 RepID=UPI0039E31746